MKSKTLLKLIHNILLPAIFLLSFISAEGQSVTTYYPKVDKQSLDYIHIMKIVVEPSQVYVVFRYNVLGNDRIAMGSQTTLRCGSYISTIHRFGVISTAHNKLYRLIRGFPSPIPKTYNMRVNHLFMLMKTEKKKFPVHLISI